jgi:hypothetical protein
VCFFLVGRSKVTPSRILEMQTAIAANAHRVLYANVDYPGDAFESMLRHLRALSLKTPFPCLDLPDTGERFLFGDSFACRIIW